MKKIIYLSFLFLFLSSCNSTEEEKRMETGDGFDRSSMLKNWADNIILPAFEQYQNKVNTLHQDAESYTDTPTLEKLNILKTSWLEAYRAYQFVGLYEIGKAEDIHFVAVSNTYPADAPGIQKNIQTATYDFSPISQIAKQGFPAIDYMLYGLSPLENELLKFYTENENATKYKKYLLALTSKLKENASLLVNDWKTSYKNEFVSSTSNTPSSAVNKMINRYIKYYEKSIRAGKIGTPAGIFSNGEVFTDKTEAYYSNNYSKVLLQDALKASKDFFNGTSFINGQSGPSLQSYLDFLKVKKNNLNLSNIINNQFSTTEKTIEKLNNSFSNELSNEAGKTKILETYDVLQKNVIYFKVDMLPALNISIDYIDADGD